MDNPLASDLDRVLSQTRDVWEELRGERLFITGGTGFFGCWLLESFLWANGKLGLGAETVVLTRRPEVFRQKAPQLAGDPAVHLHEGDVRSYIWPEGTFSHIIHAATESSTTLAADNPLLMFETIVEGTRRTLEFARQSGARRFLFVSSGAVYGRQPPDLSHISEDYAGAPDPLDPRSAYGEGKRAGELLCALYGAQHGLQTEIARCFAFVGPYLPLDAHFAIGNFIRDGLAGGPIRVNGDGTPYRSYLYAADLAVWLWTILIRGRPGRAYNVGSEEAISMADLAHRVADQFPSRPEVRVAQQAVPGRRADRYVPSVDRARRELHLWESVRLEEAIRRTVRWHATLTVRGKPLSCPHSAASWLTSRVSRGEMGQPWVA